MSEHITHVAVLEDAAGIASQSSVVCEPFKQALRKHIRIARLGSLTRSGDRFTIPLLNEVRDRWKRGDDGMITQQKIAYLLGWRGHNAADRQFKPIYRELEPEHYQRTSSTGGDVDTEAPSDVRIYHDIVVFREVYDSGKYGPFQPSLIDYRLETHPAFAAVQTGPLERLMQALVQRSLLSVHAPASRRAEAGVVVKFAKSSYQPYYVDLSRYASGYYSPDPEKMRRFIIEPNFYNAGDPILRLARSVQRGSPDASIHVERAVEAAASQSQYAQAVRKAYVYMRASSQYFTGDIGEPDLREQLDLAKPHVATGGR